MILKTVEIHTDGSCLGNPGPGGWAAVLRCDGTRREISGGYARTTNNRMEILGVIRALESLKEPCSVDLYTDSQYVAKAIQDRWLVNWRRNGWLTAAKKPVKNRDLWEQLTILLKHPRPLPLAQRPRGPPRKRTLRRTGPRPGRSRRSAARSRNVTLLEWVAVENGNRFGGCESGRPRRMSLKTTLFR